MRSCSSASSPAPADPPGRAMDAAAYDRWYETPRGRWIGEREAGLLRAALRAGPGDSVLDVGCGTGYFSRALSGAALRVTGVDLAPAWVAYAARRDPGSVFAHFQRLIRLRHADEVVREGRFELLLPDHEQLWAFTRTLGDRVLLVVANCSSAPAEIPPDSLPGLDGAELVLGTHDDAATSVLAPWESRILRLTSAG